MLLLLWRNILGVNPVQVVRAYSPPVTAVSVDADALLVPADNSALDDVTVIRFEPYALADAELDHGNLCAQLTDHLDPLNDFPVQSDQLLFR